jgi:hypothetical protein
MKIVKVRHLRCRRVMLQLARLPLREGCVMNSLRGRRDPRTGRVSGFQSREQRQHFMIGRARFCDGPNRQMSAVRLSIAWASPARRPGCGADRPASATAETLQPNERRCDPDDSAPARESPVCAAVCRCAGSTSRILRLALRLYRGNPHRAGCRPQIPSPKGGRSFVARSDGAPEIVQV